MCGIAGFIDWRGGKPPESSLTAAAESMRARGPDGQGVWSEGGAGLSHRRLAVLDTTDAGRQPMLSRDGRYVVVHNGEIYNFQKLREELDPNRSAWNSVSDTEVILAAYEKWGADCLSRFNGMFAFAIWDRREKTLFAARDRMGVKPFYYHADSGRFVFASRPRALFHLDRRLSRELDEQALRYYLELGYVPAPYSIWSGTRKLPPAHYLIADGVGVKIERYWDFRDAAPEKEWEKRNEDDLLDELDELVRASVRLRMVSDVPLGVFLSGGIDSSLIASLMAQESSAPVKTFTIRFSESEYDESGHASAVARHIGSEHSVETLNADDLLALMPVFAREFDEPFYDHAAFPTMALSRMTRKSVTVSLSGDGGDELFGGYHYYNIIGALGHFYRGPAFARKIAAAMAGAVPSHGMKLLAGALRQKDLGAAFGFSRGVAKDFPSVLNGDVLNATSGGTDLFSGLFASLPGGLCPAEAAMRADMFYTLPDDYLQKVDVASSAFSLEAREPMLDHELVQWSLRLPLSWKMRGGVNKYLLRKLAYRHVPREMLDRPKSGFVTPVRTWLKGELKEWALERINDARFYKMAPVRKDVVKRLFESHIGGARNVHPLLWTILMLISFLDAAGETGGS